MTMSRDFPRLGWLSNEYVTTGWVLTEMNGLSGMVVAMIDDEGRPTEDGLEAVTFTYLLEEDPNNIHYEDKIGRYTNAHLRDIRTIEPSFARPTRAVDTGLH